MPINIDEVARRKTAALAAIKRRFGTEDGEFDVNLFASHHLDELDSAYWQSHLGTTEPDPARVLDILVLRKHWGDDDDEGMAVFDFTLPDDITDYVMTVRFDEAGEIEEISMES
jgi:hypothetical protein